MLDAKHDQRILSADPGKAVPPAPILITEQAVAFGTTVARGAPTTTQRWIDATRVLLATVRRMHTPSTRGDQRSRYYPKHYAFLEDACLAREMDRL